MRIEPSIPPLDRCLLRIPPRAMYLVLVQGHRRPRSFPVVRLRYVCIVHEHEL